MRARDTITGLALLCLAVLCAQGRARAEVSEIRIGRQYGIAYLPLMIMEHDRLVETHARAAGLDATTARFVQLGGPAAMNDALLAGSLDYVSVGAPALARFWDKTKGTPREIKGVCAISAIPMVLNTRNPNVRTIRDFTDTNKIAMNAAKISIYAILLQMAASREFGFDQRARLDSLTVTLPHPDAAQALISGHGEIDSHFTTSPYAEEELEHPGIHTVLDSRDLVGPRGSITLLISSARFHDANPKAYAAVFSAFQSAIDVIHREKARAARIYLEMSKSRETLASVMRLLDDEKVDFTATPRGIEKYVDYMHKADLLTDRPPSWKTLFFSNAHDLDGD